MYHMALPPQFGSAHPPQMQMHSSVFPGPLLPPVNHSHSVHLFTPHANGNNATEPPPATSLHSSPNLSQGSFYHNQPSVYINPYLSGHQQNSLPTNNLMSPHGIHNLAHSHSQPVSYRSPTNPALSTFHVSHPNRTVIQSHSHMHGNRRQPLSVDEELLEEMSTLLLGFLETEDSPHKMEQREKLEYVIMEYLAITPHTLKFMFQQILEVLESSILNKPNFDAHNAACAFDALAQYAANLISQPWRKEFREVKLHNGFWVHQVASHLSGAECILELMGYICGSSKNIALSESSSSSLSRTRKSDYYVLQGVIDPDLIARLALDCMIAYCECQCLNKIKEGVAEYSLTWAQILQFRQLYIGGVDVTVRHLLFTLRQRMNPPPYSTPISPSSPVATSPPPVPVRQSSSFVATSSTPYFMPSPKASSTPGLQHSPMDSRLEASASVDDYRSKPTHQLSPDNQKNTRSHSLTGATSSSMSGSGKLSHINNYTEDKCDGALGLNTRTGKGSSGLSRVPTAKLIDLDSVGENASLSKSNHSLLPKVLPHKSSSKSYSQQSSNRCLPNDPPDCSAPSQPPPEALQSGTFEEHLEATLNLVNNPSKQPSQTGKGSDGTSWETWDFVFRGLEKKGYNKDVGDRGDILHDITRQKNLDANPIASKNVNLNMNNHRKDISKNRPLTINQALQQFNYDNKEKSERVPSSKSSISISHSYLHENHKRNSLYDNLSGGFETANQDSEESEERKTLDKPLKKVSNTTRQEVFNRTFENGSSSHRSTSGSNKNIDHSSKNKLVEPQERYNSAGEVTWACTTCTYENKMIVTICEMCGKSKDPGPDSKPLESGGKQCHLCTLINERNVEICSACGVDLKGSSTYI